ncbi:hypothetical protein PHMEG_00010436 [Phytophthora megakarya]|uniref:Eukaryotic/viral aspartic protease n=1 Tax=Phytophthora megakarya TaxID=4795 RepID=A0A225WEA5_9STRA|nr:hypothetical protein PHMEG_00010436 [Phytophthora megakarya]
MTSRMTPITEPSVSFDDSGDYSDSKEDTEDDYLEEKTPVSELSEGAVVSLGHSAVVKSLARNLTEELEGMAGPAMDSDDDGSDGVKLSPATRKETSQSSGFRPPINGDTPVANKAIGKTLAIMMTKSSWMQNVRTTLARQAVWMNLGRDFVVPIHSTSTRQVDQDTVMLLRAMGCELPRFPSNAALDDWAPADAGTALRKGKKKLRAAFGVEEIAPGLKQNESSTDVFGSKGSPYMHDSHMVTPSLRAAKPEWYYSAKREDKERVCDYLNRLNGYARNAGVQFENGGSEAKDHVEHFLDTCGDRGLEERLVHVRVMVFTTSRI